MENYEISSSLDWQSIRKKLTNSKSNLPMFKNDVTRMLQAIDAEIVKLGNLEITARNQKSKSSIARVNEQLDIINKQIRNFNKLYMFALLSQS